ncbi:glycoside hydrolase family 3 protein [Maridesulfovibrio hydrothermalis]|uniref:beta-N-acetylhexosaminidase n=1 Tax=Maridesulfovibrio hydrothermalis AM13 = DSM 14728 TaxID=1121451 RepID=L0RCL7_9BACT|nr:glycoside hydrolase family 3 protein [Maridesulfovibrio hydrothermalis]CCO23952.1 Glycoside hydrolase family 3 domain protein [Maridesulfovibrio hydrothermalis AM13 = DSM 14728]
MTRLFFLILFFSIMISGCALHKTGSEPSELDIMIGQMVMVGFRGMEAGAESFVAKDIRDAGVGGVILFSKDCALNSTVRNISDSTQLKKLTTSLQAYSQIPLFIAVDQEGGIISRLTGEMGFPSTPSAAELGNSGDIQAAFRAGRLTGQTLRSVGINMDFAPVVDVNRNAANPVIAALQRSFSDDPAIVARFAEAFIDGLHSEKIISSIKHFPGHGSSVGDSHHGFTDVTETWSELEFYPFAKIISDGKADMVMTAHIYNKKLDRRYPATLSRKVITGILRRKLGFKGIIVTDDMQMGAISSRYGFKEAIHKAVYAGADILLFGNNLTYEPGLGTKAVNALKELVHEGKITERRIKQSYHRIMLGKKKQFN